MNHLKNIATALFWAIVESPVYFLCLVKGRGYGIRIQIGSFIQAVQPEQMGTSVRYGHSVLIQPFKEFKHNG
jgi:hypothetical protein